MGKSSWGSFVPVMERICRRLSDIFFFILSLSRSFFRLLPSRGTLPMEFYKTIPLLVSQQTYKPIRRWIRDSFDPPPLGSQYRADSKRRVLFGVKPWKTRKILLSNASRTMDSCHSLFNSPAKTVFALSIIAVYACVCIDLIPFRFIFQKCIFIRFILKWMGFYVFASMVEFFNETFSNLSYTLILIDSYLSGKEK